MADMIPVKRHVPEHGLAEFEPGDTVAVAHGGTGATTPAQARLNLGIVNSSVSTINGQPHLTYDDTVRLKTLSSSLNAVTFGEGGLTANDWIRIGNAADALSGHISPFDATIVGITIHCEDANGNTADVDVYINGAVVYTETVTGTDDVIVGDMTLDIDINQFDKIRTRLSSGSGTIQDTIVTIWLRWRA